MEVGNEFNRSVAGLNAFTKSERMSAAGVLQVSESDGNARCNEHGNTKSTTVIREMEIDGSKNSKRIECGRQQCIEVEEVAGEVEAVYGTQDMTGKRSSDSPAGNC